MATWPKVCPVDQCEEICSSLSTFVSHIRRNHQLVSNLYIKCPADACPSQFTSSDTFRRHVERRHRSEYRVRQYGKMHDAFVENCSIPINHQGNDVGDCDNFEMAPSASSLYDNFMHAVAERSALLLLQIEHKFNLPTSVARGVHEEALNFAFTMCQELTSVATARVKELNVNDKVLDTILLSPELEKSCKSIPVTSLTSLRNFGLVEPVDVDLLELAECVGKPKCNPLQNGKRPKMHYVPILQTIQSFMSHPDVMQSVLREKSSTEHFKSFRDGSIYRDHPLFQVEPNALRLTLYTDELEVCNPLGGNNKKHKICCVYFQVGNIGTEHLSSLDSVHLCLLVKDSYRTLFGYDVVLKLLIDDLKVLASDGIWITMKGGGTYHFRGAVSTFCGDNLSAHHLGGFRRTFSSGKICRWCMADYANLSRISSETDCTLRTEESMRRQAYLVSQDPLLDSVYGIAGPSVLSDIPYFRIPLCLPPDAMHDILEKLMCLTLKVVMKGLDSHKVLLFPTVCSLWSSFKFGVLDKKNKHSGPRKVSLQNKKAIHGSASQKWHLFHFFSLVIGPHVPQGNRYWQLYLLLNQICDIVLADTISEEMCRELSRLVKKHHDLWIQVVRGAYPPKLHYLIHYARFIKMVGPLRYQWCMRFEAFHQYIKRMSQKCNNFIEITKTMASRVQRKRCLVYSGSNAFPSQVQLRGKQQSIGVDELPMNLQAYVKAMCPSLVVSNIVEVSSVLFKGLNVRQKLYYVTEVSDEGVPVFYLAHRIFIVSGEVVIMGTFVNSISFNLHLHAYEIPLDVAPHYICLSADKLRPFHVLHAYSCEGKKFLKLRFTAI